MRFLLHFDDHSRDSDFTEDYFILTSLSQKLYSPVGRIRCRNVLHWHDVGLHVLPIAGPNPRTNIGKSMCAMPAGDTKRKAYPGILAVSFPGELEQRT